MAFLSYHYLVTSYFLTIWIGNRVSLPIVLALHYAVQLCVWLSDTGAGMEGLLFGYQAITTLLGVAVGRAYLRLTEPNPLLKIEAGYEPAFVKFFVAFAAFMGTQLFYSELPPPGSSFGILFSLITGFLVIMGTWYSMTFVEKAEHNSAMFYVGWFGVLASMQLMFYLVFTNLVETWVAMIAPAPALLVLGIMNCVRGTWKCLTCA
jgi:hypothetical protein